MNARPPSPGHTTVPYPLACIGCGYDLQDLPQDGLCPECGVPIGRSISGDHLAASPPDHRRRLVRGAGLALAGAILGWIFLPMLAVGLLLKPTGPLAITPASLTLAAALLLTALGWMGLIRPDPEKIDHESPSARRRTLLLQAGACGWIALATVLAFNVLQAILPSLGTSSWLSSSQVQLTVTAGGFIALASMMLLSWPIAGHFSRLAHRLLEPDLAERTATLKHAGLAGVLLLLLSFIAALPGPAIPRLRATTLGTYLEPMVLALALVAMLAWAVLYHTLLAALSRALKAVSPPPSRPARRS